MNPIHFLTSIVIATAIVGGSAVAFAVHAQVPADQTRHRAAKDGCRNDAQAASADRHDDKRCDRSARQGQRSQQAHAGRGYRADPKWVSVANASLPDQEAFGWQYFSDQRVSRAVVISPSGEYYLSLGNGPRQITGPAGQALTTR